MSIVYRASELGSCTRRLVLGRVGYEPKAPTQKWLDIFARGDVTEEEVKKDLRAQGWRVEREQEEVVLPISDNIHVVGHIDGVRVEDIPIGTPEKTRLLEIKRMNNAYWNVVKNGGWYVDGLMEKYRWQISAYMLALDLEVVLVARNGDTGEDLYLYAEEPFYSRNDIAARVLTCEGRVRSYGVLDDLGSCDRADYPCPFYYTHLDDEREEVEDEEEVEALGVAYLAAKDREREAKEESARIRGEIEVALSSRRKVRAGGITITKYVSKRANFDRKRAEAAGLDLSEYTTTSESESIRVTAKEKNVDEGEASS